MRRFLRLGAVLMLALGTACGVSESEMTAATTESTTTERDSEPETTDAATTTTETTTTTEATTTSRRPTTTSAPTPNYHGIVWRSVVDPDRVNTSEPAPAFEADGITARLDMVLVVPRASRTELGYECDDEARIEQDVSGGELAEQCLYVQWAFDVSPDFPVDEFSPEGSLSGAVVITPEGRQVDSIFAASAFPGTVDNVLRTTFAHGTAGSTLKFTTGSNFVARTTHTYSVPPIEAMQPIFWD